MNTVRNSPTLYTMRLRMIASRGCGMWKIYDGIFDVIEFILKLAYKIVCTTLKVALRIVYHLFLGWLNTPAARPEETQPEMMMNSKGEVDYATKHSSRYYEFISK